MRTSICLAAATTAAILLPTTSLVWATITIDPNGVGATDVYDQLSQLSNPVADPLRVGHLRVGSSSHGELAITNGGQATAGLLRIGLSDSGFGVVTVEGPHSLLQVSDRSDIGIFGDAELNILGGAQVELSNVLRQIANQPGSEVAITVDGPGSSLVADGGIRFGQGSAMLSLRNGGRYEDRGDLYDPWILDGDDTINLDGGHLDMNWHVIRVRGEGQFNFTGGLLRHIRSFGGDLDQQGGTLQLNRRVLYRLFPAPSDSFWIGRNYSVDSSSTLQLDLFGELHVGGTATLAGTMELSWPEGRAIEFRSSEPVEFLPGPEVGEMFEVLTADNINGRFDEIHLPEIASDRLVTWAVRYNTDTGGTDNLTIEVLTSILTGDFDESGAVDAVDFAAWENGFGQFTGGGATHADGDADADGDVDGDDFLVWQSQFSSVAGGSGSFVGNVATQLAPEPTSSLLAMLLWAIALGASRDRKFPHLP